jgi:pimeloyl-ACP methyl ester carboxylesterase
VIVVPVDDGIYLAGRSHRKTTDITSHRGEAMPDRVIDTNGAMIRVAESGVGEPALVFLHYWGGSARTWKRVVDRLGDRVHCLALNQRGWGGSIGTDGRFDLAAMADDVETVVGTLGLWRCVLVGHSMGGKVAEIVAGRRPKALAGLVFHRASTTNAYARIRAGARCHAGVLYLPRRCAASAFRTGGNTAVR